MGTEPADYSDPLILTTSKWGDTVLNTVFPSPPAPPQFAPPEGIIQITDVLAILQKFQNLGTATVSARVDLLGASNPKYIVDHGIGIDDVLQALFAFQAIKYPSEAIANSTPPPPTGRPCSAVASGGE